LAGIDIPLQDHALDRSPKHCAFEIKSRLIKRCLPLFDGCSRVVQLGVRHLQSASATAYRVGGCRLPESPCLSEFAISCDTSLGEDEFAF
jgi:hypothetical protein